MMFASPSFSFSSIRLLSLPVVFIAAYLKGRHESCSIQMYNSNLVLVYACVCVVVVLRCMVFRQLNMSINDKYRLCACLYLKTCFQSIEHTYTHIYINTVVRCVRKYMLMCVLFIDGSFNLEEDPLTME